MTESVMKDYPTVAQSFGITGIIVLGTILLMPINLILKEFINQEASMLLYYLLAVGIPFLIVNSIKERKTGKNSFDLSLKNKRIIPFITLGTIALLFGIVSPIISLIPAPEFIKKALMEMGGQTSVFSFILLVIAAPILEELIFRGIMLDGLLKNYSPQKSILISSLFFGLVHLNPWQLVSGFILGIFLGWIYYKTQSLLPSIIIHATANLSAFSIRLFVDVESQMNETLAGMYGGITNLVLVCLGSIIVITVCVYQLKKEFKKIESSQLQI